MTRIANRESMGRPQGATGKTKFNPLRAEVMRLVGKENLSFGQVAKRLGVTRNVVGGLADRMGIKRSGAVMSAPVDPELIKRTADLITEGKSNREIAEALGVHVRTTHDWCRRARALMRKRTPPRAYAYRLAAFDPVVARALETYEALR